jgi:antitoxin component of MazEF toxin-antitoxin module
MQQSRLLRVGNSFGVIVPLPTLRELGWFESDTIEQRVVDGRLMLENRTQHPVQMKVRKGTHHDVEFSGRTE